MLQIPGAADKPSLRLQGKNVTLPFSGYFGN
jgi:hypothetical protein